MILCSQISNLETTLQANVFHEQSHNLMLLILVLEFCTEFSTRCISLSESYLQKMVCLSQKSPLCLENVYFIKCSIFQGENLSHAVSINIAPVLQSWSAVEIVLMADPRIIFGTKTMLSVLNLGGVKKIYGRIMMPYPCLNSALSQIQLGCLILYIHLSSFCKKLHFCQCCTN